MVLILEVSSEPCQTSKMEFFVKIVNGLKPVVIFARKSILDIWQGSEYSFGWLYVIVGVFRLGVFRISKMIRSIQNI